MSIIIGLVIGLVLGLTGAGGSVFAVPLLIIGLQLAPQQAIGISLGAVAASALFGLLLRLRNNTVQWMPALIYSAIGALLAPLGNYLNQFISSTLLLGSFSAMVILVAARMWYSSNQQPQNAQVVRAGNVTSEEDTNALCRFPTEQKWKISPRCFSAMSLGAVITGLLSGFFGVGGGFLIVPTLLMLTSMSIQQAVSTSLVVISLISTSGFISYLINAADFNFLLLGEITLGGVAGMAVGFLISRKVAGPALQKLFAVLMLVMAIVTLATLNL